MIKHFEMLESNPITKLRPIGEFRIDHSVATRPIHRELNGVRLLEWVQGQIEAGGITFSDVTERELTLEFLKINIMTLKGESSYEDV